MEKNCLLNFENLRDRKYCILQAYGRHFDVESFWEQTVFEPQSLIFKGKIGELANPQPTADEITAFLLDYMETKWLILLVSLDEQKTARLANAINFLRRYRNEIKRLSNYPQVEYTNLHFESAGNKSESELSSAELRVLVQECGIKTITSS